MEMRYCPVCGTMLTEKNDVMGGSVLRCEICGEERFPMYSTAVSAAVWNGDRTKLLLIRQYGGEQPVFPAGYVDKGETAEEAVIRELREELGLTVQSLRFVRSRFYAPSETLMLHYDAAVQETEASPNHEVDGWCWFPPEEADELIRGGLARVLMDDTLRVEDRDSAREEFYGQSRAPLAVRQLYEDLSRLWRRETCTPRMRKDWTPENASLGQCSVTAFLVQDLFGGKVWGIPLEDGSVHCYNEAQGIVFDFTSAQFGGKTLRYEGNPEQSREGHFARTEKEERYELLKKLLLDYRSGTPEEV